MKKNVLVSCVFIILIFFTTNVKSQNWMHTGSSMYGIAAYGQRGYSVETNSDGSRIIVGSPGSTENTFRIYQWNTETNDWIYEYGITAASNTGLGWDVDISDNGERVVVIERSNHKAKVYSYNGTSWSLSATISHTMGSSSVPKVAISGDGNYIAIRALDEATIYYYNGSSWASIGSSITFASNYADYDIDIDYDGSRFTMGLGIIDGSFSVRVYEWNGSDWDQLGADMTGSSNYAGFGQSISMSNSGNRIAIGCPGYNISKGAGYIYEYSSSSWTQRGFSYGSAYSQSFGTTISISNDGTKYSVAGNGSGSTDAEIKTFENTSGSTWVQVGQTLYYPSSYGLRSIAISGDGDNIITGCPLYNSSQGFAATYGPVVAPTTQANSITFSNVQHNQMQLDWTNGNGAKRVVFMKVGASGSLVVNQNNSYTASSSYGYGTSISYGGTWYCVYNGTGSSVNVINLLPKTTYQCQVFEYNGNLSYYNQYMTATSTGNPASQATASATPTVSSTTAASSITATTASSGGNISANGGQSVTARGVVWNRNTSGTPTVDSYDGITDDGTGTGSFTSSLTNLTGNITYYVRAYATNSIGTAYGNQINFTTLNYTDITWDGSGGSDWNTEGNWDLNQIPTSNHDVIIPANISPYPSIGNSAVCNNLVINSGTPNAELSVAYNGSLTVNGNLSNSGTMTIESDALGTGSLIIEGTASGNVIFKRYLNEHAKIATWHYVSSPVAGQSLGGTWMDDNNIAIATPARQFYRFDEDNDYWIYYGYTGLDPEAFGDTEFVTARSYAITRDGVGNLSFTGTVRTDATINYAATYTSNKGAGFNLVGNPFTSTIAITEVGQATNNFLADNSGILADEYQAIYIWNETNAYTYGDNDYKVICNSGFDGEGHETEIEQDFIQAGQGFMVKVKQEGNIAFNRDTQKHGTATYYKSKESWPGIELKVSGNGISNSTIITFNDNMTLGLDPSYDVGKLKGNPNIALYTKLVNDNGIDFAIQALPTNNAENYIISVGVDVIETQELNFSANTVELDNYDIILEDRNLDVFTDLSKSTYTATVDNSGTGRFFLHFRDINGIDNDEYKLNTIQTYASNNTLYILNPQQKQGTVTIYNLTGQKVAAFELNGNAKQQQTLNVSEVINIVKVQTDNEVISGKVVFR